MEYISLVESSITDRNLNTALFMIVSENLGAFLEMLSSKIIDFASLKVSSKDKTGVSFSLKLFIFSDGW